MRRLLSVLAVFTVACTPHHKPPVVVPTPPPAPGPVTITDNLTRTSGGWLTDIYGKAIDVLATIWCCMGAPEKPADPPPGWPMMSAPLMDRAISLTPGPRKANWFEFRAGPFCSTCESEYPGVGAYVGDSVGGGINPALLDKLDEQVIAAGQRGARAMVVLVDCWYCRHTEIPHPWDGTAARGLCGVRVEEWQRRWIEAVVTKVGRHHHVVFLDGNECDVNPGYDGTYPDQVQAIVREVEAREGFPVHLFGTQSGWDSAQRGKADFVVLHADMFAPGPLAGKPTLVLEYNPNPPYSAKAMRAMDCGAKKTGTYWGFWRHEMLWDEWTEALRAASSDGCEGVSTTGCPTTPKPTAALRCKRFGVHGGLPLFDCTPLQANGQPIWPEGNGDIRAACEWESMGDGDLGFTFPAGSPLSVDHLAHGGLAFAVAGSGSSPIACTIPKMPAGWRGCIGEDGLPLVVTVP